MVQGSNHLKTGRFRQTKFTKLATVATMQALFVSRFARVYTAKRSCSQGTTESTSGNAVDRQRPARRAEGTELLFHGLSVAVL